MAIPLNYVHEGVKEVCKGRKQLKDLLTGGWLCAILAKEVEAIRFSPYGPGPLRLPRKRCVFSGWIPPALFFWSFLGGKIIWR